MLFNSREFLFSFLPLTFVGFFIIGHWSHRGAAAWLALASLVFYGWWSINAVPLLVGSVCVNYLFGNFLVPASGNSESLRKAGLVVAIALNLFVLGVFKYADFFILNANVALTALHQKPLQALGIILPIGISFFTFTQIAFLVDCWQGKVAERNFTHYLLFVTYFPHLIAGPVLHHSQIMPQFARQGSYHLNWQRISEALIIFHLGLAKKILLADSLADFVNDAFAQASTGHTITFVDGWAAAVSYALQLYFDFSGYSDMAIGLSLLFGVTLPANFRSPYKANNIIEFWRRWHISLSTFLRDYLYIPLGGNRFGTGRRYLNLFTTMLLGGLWHGASWTFVLWGGAHGIFLSINHAWQKLWHAQKAPSPLGYVAGWTLTFVAVCFAWVLFRADTLATASRIYQGMIGLHGIVLPDQVAKLIPHGTTLFRTVGNMPALGSGAVMGVFEQLTLIMLGLLISFFGSEIGQLCRAVRFAVVCVSSGFIVHALFFSTPKEFMYYQF